MNTVKSALQHTLPHLGFVGPKDNLWTRPKDDIKVYNLGSFTNVYKGEELVEVFDEDAFKAPKRQFIKRLETLCA
ncbi:hypothetical protein JCM19232_5095 [Vibrio ishigakensis]|uniref:Uncharacterized protein n=1 Tax=Vibrio ishigakensis TaxID=1481914 RepID=A0A0B8QGZ3_9VIBR|nr:hypothetical protein [Vibrio ishigakensis]GAM56586.1 hypothetical protein JCM19231_5165 [Vibrio ishigakensis]GAM62131.1 hypothetical protein JCM19232_5095 [Vibrio ishigakensis]GAM68930.1 hypothetical protein JCM19236_2927 [Vibrio sp. JCM 19236]GAM76352.1 hypothetical protein JCM19241_3889 [Vibrio ishigakensis]